MLINLIHINLPRPAQCNVRPTHTNSSTNKISTICKELIVASKHIYVKAEDAMEDRLCAFTYSFCFINLTFFGEVPGLSLVKCI